jgi:AcrR family transcriptional regulator
MAILGKTKKDVLSEFRTTEILESARRVFAAKGFHQATVDEIAEVAGVAKGTLYLYYPSKRAIYWDALKHGIGALHDELAKRLAESDSPPEKVRAFIAIKMRYFEQHRDFFKIYFSEFGNALTHPAQVHRQFQNLYVKQAQLLESVLADAAKEGLIRDIRPGVLALAVSDLTRGMIIQRLLGWSKGGVDEDIEFVFDLVWKGIGL